MASTCLACAALTSDKDKAPMISIVNWVFKYIPYEGLVDFFFPVIRQDKLGCTFKRIFNMEMVKDESYYMKVIEKTILIEYTNSFYYYYYCLCVYV